LALKDTDKKGHNTAERPVAEKAFADNPAYSGGVRMRAPDEKEKTAEGGIAKQEDQGDEKKKLMRLLGRRGTRTTCRIQKTGMPEKGFFLQGAT